MGIRVAHSTGREDVEPSAIRRSRSAHARSGKRRVVWGMVGIRRSAYGVLH